MQRQDRRRKQPVDDFEERRGYWNFYIRYTAVFLQVVKEYFRLREAERGRNISDWSVKSLVS
jgi:hypothetical protein